MASKVRSASFFYNDKKVGTLQDITYEIDTGDSMEQTDDDTYFTDGRTTAKITAGTLVPLAGIGVSVIQDALNKKDSNIKIGIVDGKIHQMAARLKTGTFTGEVANGTLKGKLEFMCKAPKPIG